MSFRTLTANRLGDGAVVYLTGDGDWSRSINDGRLITSTEEEDDILRAARRCLEAHAVVEPYLIDIIEETGHRRPAGTRELIRSLGPSNSWVPAEQR
jgi:hypothetical protein